MKPSATLTLPKIREAGFNGVWNTEHSFCHWLADLIERRILPAGR